MSDIRAHILVGVLLATRVAAAEPGPEPDSAGLVAEGERQHQAHADDQALANFLAAYARAPSPALLLRIADVLHDMSRFADVANTYQRFLLDPASAGDPSAPRVQQELAQLDAQLTVLTVRVFPRGSAISLDGGPFVPVGGALITRVRPGLHLVRIRAADPAAADPAPHELTVNGSEGEAKDVVATLPGAPATPPPPVAHGAPAVPERAYGWLITGTQYATDDPTGRARTVRARDDGRPLAALVPRDEPSERAEAEAAPRGDDDDITSGAIAAVRIDGKGRGAAGGLGVVFARGKLEAEVLVLRSDQTGGYVGVRYRFLTGLWRPYASLGVPGFVFDHQELQPDMTTTTSKQLALGLRLAAGLEVRVTHHLSVLADVGYEHFWFGDDRFDADLLVPSIGVIGRL